MQLERIIDDEAEYKSKTVLSVHSPARELEKTVVRSKEDTPKAGSLLVQVKDFFKLRKEERRPEKDGEAVGGKMGLSSVHLESIDDQDERTEPRPSKGRQSDPECTLDDEGDDEGNIEHGDEQVNSSIIRSSILRREKQSNFRKVVVGVRQSPQASLSGADFQQQLSQKKEEPEHPLNLKRSTTSIIRESHFDEVLKKKNIQLVDEQLELYQKNKLKIDERHHDLKQIDRIRERLKSERIKCVKYNHSLDDEVQRVVSFEGYLQLSKDGKFLKIVNKKVIRKKAYAYDPDYRVIQRKREEFEKTLLRGKNSEIMEENFVEGRDFVYKKSNSSMALDDIQGILYGGLSSRFWMLRKHMICSNVKKMVDGLTAFYSWQCLTIQLKHREVDLVIPNQRDMDDVLEVIIDAMNTVNGQKNSADLIRSKMHKIKYRNELKRQKELAKR